MSAETCNSVARGSREALGPLLGTAVVLIVLTFCFSDSFVLYYRHLVQRNQVSFAETLANYSDFGVLLFYFCELVVALYIFRSRLTYPKSVLTELRVSGSSLRHIALGVAVGLLAFLASVPALPSTEHSYGLVSFLVDHAYNVSGALLIFLLGLLLPIVSELFFRGVLLQGALTARSWVAAFALSVFAFAILWPVFNPLAGAILGIATSVLFYRTRSIFGCVVANSVFTLSGVVLLAWQSLHRV